MRAQLPRPIILFLSLALMGVCRSDEPKLNTVYTGKVSALSVPPTAMGDDWTGPTGVVVDDLSDLKDQPEDVKPMVQALSTAYRALGVVGLADFTYRRKSKPLEQLTLKLFLFESETKRQDWWTKKYRHDGWEKFYTVPAGLPYDAVDSTQVTKRIIGFGNVWMTCSSTVEKTDQHIKLLELYIGQIKNLAGKKA